MLVFIIRISTCEGVSVTVTHIYAVCVSSRGRDGSSKYHGVKVNSLEVKVKHWNLTLISSPQFADILACLAVTVGAGVRVGGGGVFVYCCIAGVGHGGGSTGEREDTADSEGGGAGS